MKTVIKRFDLNVTTEAGGVPATFEVDKNVIALIGMVTTSDRDDQLYYRGTQRLEINGEEIFPENYESKLIMSGLNVAPKDKYYSLGNMKPGNRTIKVNFKDVPTNIISFTPYRVSYYFYCEIE